MISRSLCTRLVASALIVVCYSVASAQAAALDVPSTPQAGSAPWLAKYDAATGNTLEVVLTSAPTKRQRCHVQSFDADQLTCSPHLGRSPKVFRRDQIDAVIVQGKAASSATKEILKCAPLGAGIIAGSILIGIFAPLPLALFFAIPLGLFGLVVLGLAGMCADDVGDAPAFLAYLRPGAQLQVPVN